MTAPERKLPGDPIRFSSDCVPRGRILWTYHVNLRLVGRFSARATILAAVDTYQLVETYPGDKYLPIYLVPARHASQAFHVLFAADIEGDIMLYAATGRRSLRAAGCGHADRPRCPAVGQQALELDFLKRALRHVKTPPTKSDGRGGTASSPLSRQ